MLCWLFFLLVLHVHMCYIDFFLLALHVYMCNISCSSFYLYMCLDVILTVLPFSYTYVKLKGAEARYCKDLTLSRSYHTAPNIALIRSYESYIA